MDIVTALRYVFDHNQQVIAGLIAVILITAILLFIRALSQEKSESPSSRAGSSNFDIGAIESALRRVMAAQTGALAAAAATAATSALSANHASPRSESMSAGTHAANVDRDAKVQELAREIDRLTQQLASKDVSPFASENEVDPAVVTALREKIDELQGKLSEYEIIEDDIADLSRFKEENAELRRELEQLKKNATVKTETVAARETVSPQPVPVVSVSPAQAPLAEIDGDDLVMKEFASSIQIQSASADIGGDGSSVLADALDTDKMLSEVAGLVSVEGGDHDALGGVLDTEKLMAEVGSLKTKAPAQAQPAAPPVVPFNAGVETSTGELEDDLLAEFKDSNEEGQ